MVINLIPLEYCPTRILHGYDPCSVADWVRADKNRVVGGYRTRGEDDDFVVLKRKKKVYTAEQKKRNKERKAELRAFKAKQLALTKADN
jgi:hypothetical protein